MKIAMCFGTFDKLHPGHLSYLRQAKRYGDYLLVVVGRDENVVRIKGKLPAEDEKERLNNIKKIEFVDKAVLGQLRDKFKVVRKYQPEAVCLGYDQKVDLAELKNNFKGRLIRLKPYKENKYKSSLINSK